MPSRISSRNRLHICLVSQPHNWRSHPHECLCRQVSETRLAKHKATKQPQESMLKDSYEERENTKATHVAVMLDRQRSPVDSAETLKELAGLTVLPSTVTATRATWGLDRHMRERTCDVAIVDLPAIIGFTQRMVFTEVPVWFD